LAAVATALILAGPGAPRWNASTPLGEADLTVGTARAGARADALRPRPLSTAREGGALVWRLDGAELRFAGDPPRLVGARIDGGKLAGPRGLLPGDALEKVYAALPVAELEEQPSEDFTVLYARTVRGGEPVAPYGVLMPAGECLRVHLAAPLDAGGGFAICDIDVDPDTDRITRIAWEMAGQDSLF
jgi:hypothetical protein